MKRLLSIGVSLLVLAMTPLVALAIPVLQVGAPAGAGDTGMYADYQASTTDPTETNTAITENTTLYFAGVYGPNTQNLGGQYTERGRL